MKADKLRDKSIEDLTSQVSELQSEIMKFRLQLATGVVDNVRKARTMRREIARIKTILRERELAAAKGK